MNYDIAKQLADLQCAFESGVLPEDTCDELVAALAQKSGLQIDVSGSGSAALFGGISTGDGGVAAREIHGGVHINPPGARLP